MESGQSDSDLNHVIAGHLRRLRVERKLTLEALAERSGVSRSAISLIERGESSPTAVVLARLTAALGVTLGTLFEAEAPVPSPLARCRDQPIWRDPATGYGRRNLSPPGFESALQLVEVEFPPGARVAYDNGPAGADIDQQVWLLDGVMDIGAGEAAHRLEAGDCLAMRLDGPTHFHNPGDRPARYLVALASAGPRRRAWRTP